jgi:uncharacterized membrane protein
MSWKRKFVYSFVSMIVADFCCAAFLTLLWMHSRAESLFTFTPSIFWVMSVFIVPGWLLTLPLILAVRGSSKRSLRLLGAGRIAAGSLIILIWAMVDHFNWSIIFFNVYALPTSIIATGVYLWLFVNYPAGTNREATVSHPRAVTFRGLR